MQNFLPKNWRKVKLGEVVEINPQIAIERGEEYPYLDMADVQPFSRITKWEKRRVFNGSGARFENEDILFARITPCLEHGKITRVLNLGTPAFGSTEFFVLRGKAGISDSRFIYYLSLTHKVRKIAEQSMIGVSGRQRVERAAFENIEVKIPNITEQRRIASILSAFDDKIELNNKINHTLEQMAQAIFKEWFVDFRFPGYKKAEFVESELGRIPKGWKRGKVESILNINSGFAFKSSSFVKEGRYKLVTIRNVQDGKFIDECADRIKDTPEETPEFCYLNSGDILLSLTGNVGRVCFVYGNNYILNQRVAKLEPLNPKDIAFVYFLFRQKLMQNTLISLAKGTAQPNLSPVETMKLDLALPSRELLDLFSSFANPIFKTLVENSIQNKNLARARDLLLPKLMSGKIVARI